MNPLEKEENQDSVMQLEDSYFSVENMEDLGPDCINDMPLAQELLTVIETHVRKGFFHWCKIVKSVAGTKEDPFKLWSSSYLTQIDETLGVLLSDMGRVRDETCEKIAKQLEKLEAVCKAINQPFPRQIGENQRCLLEELSDLKQQISEYEKVAEQQKAELTKLQKKQDKFCKELGQIPTFSLSYPPMPTAEQLEAFQKHLETLEALKFEREERYCQFKQELLEYAEEIEYKPIDTFEEKVFYSEDFQCTTENMEKLELFVKELKNTRQNTINEIHQLRSRVEDLWKLLDIDLKDQDEFRTEFQKNSVLTLEALRNEVKRCEEMKKVNIKAFLDKLRVKLSELWNKCRCTDQQKRSFKYFDDDCYTEDLLDLHELEIRKWQDYYQCNEELLSSLDKHEEWWRKLMSLDNSATSINRLKNRGGKLLQEEKERNRLQKIIPKIEDRIEQLAETYLQENDGVPFLFTTTLLPIVFSGRTVEEYLNELRVDRENRRKEQLSARKQHCDQTSVHKKSPFGLASTSRALTPAKSATAKRKILGTPLTDNVKRSRNGTQQGATLMGSTPLAVPKIKISKPATDVGQKGRLRRSIEKTKRRRSGRLVTAGKNQNYLDKKENSRDTTYSIFENELSNKDEAINSTVVYDLRNTPQKTFLPMSKTPIRTPGALRTANGTPNRSPRIGNGAKLTACRSNIKLLF